MLAKLFPHLGPTRAGQGLYPHGEGTYQDPKGMKPVDPLAKKVAAKFVERQAREGETLSNPVIENMANSDFVSEGYNRPAEAEAENPFESGPEDKPPFEKAEPKEKPPQKVIPGAK